MTDQSPRRIAICTSPRTGSNLLIDSLAKHPQAKPAGEWFNKHNIHDATRQRHGKNCNLFKFFPSHYHHPDFRDITDECCIVFLYREDRQAQIRSWDRACRTGWWVSEVQGQPMDPPTEGFEYWIVRAEELFKPMADLTVSYEAMIENWDQTIERIESLANWSKIYLGKERKSLT